LHQALPQAVLQRVPKRLNFHPSDALIHVFKRLFAAHKALQ
jgi:hypothetical protein